MGKKFKLVMYVDKKYPSSFILGLFSPLINYFEKIHIRMSDLKEYSHYKGFGDLDEFAEVKYLFDAISKEVTIEYNKPFLTTIPFSYS